MDILLLQFCAVARENMESSVFLRMAERFEVISRRYCEICTIAVPATPKLVNPYAGFQNPCCFVMENSMILIILILILK